MGTMTLKLEITVSGKVGKYLIIGTEDMKRNNTILDFDNGVACYELQENPKKVFFVQQLETKGETSTQQQNP